MYIYKEKNYVKASRNFIPLKVFFFLKPVLKYNLNCSLLRGLYKINDERCPHKTGRSLNREVSQNMFHCHSKLSQNRWVFPETYLKAGFTVILKWWPPFERCFSRWILLYNITYKLFIVVIGTKILL